MSNEITVKLKCTIKEICNILEDKKFRVVDKFILNDTYYIPKSLVLENMNYRQILSQAILLRDITELMPYKKVIKLTFKNKQIDENGDILSQSKIDCEIINAEEGNKFLEALGYNKLMNILENTIVYEKDGLQLEIKDIKNGDNLVEVETKEDNKELDTIEKVKRKIDELLIPIDTNNYFVKKAEVKLEKTL